jgi:flagellin
MSFSILNNPTALSAMNANRKATRELQDSFRKLSSGARITRAADDAAGLAVASNLSTRAGSQRVAMRNTNDGISVVQTAEGALSEVGDMFKRMRELAVQASSETLSDTERGYAQEEFSELQSEIGRIRNVTEFNGSKLIDGTYSGGMNVQVGANDSVNDRIAITANDVATLGGASTAGTAVSNFAIRKAAITDADGTSHLIGLPTGDGISNRIFEKNSAIARAAAINATTGDHGVTATVGPSVYTGSADIKAALGKPGQVIQFGGGGTSIATIDLEGVNIEDLDADGALQTLFQSEIDAVFGSGTFNVDTSSGRMSISASDGRSFGWQAVNKAELLIGETTGTKQAGSGTLTLSSASSFTHDFKGTDWGFAAGPTLVSTSDLTSSAVLRVDTVSNARAAISQIDGGIDGINSERSKLGAVQNRLESALNNLQTSNENMLSSASRIQDADFAYESAQMARAQIMQQASTAVLGQANQLPQSLLRLL